MSLIELVLAVTILAVSFLPVIGVMGTTIKGTTRDELLVKAIHLGQTRMNVVMQFPYHGIVDLGGGGAGPTWTFGTGATQWQIATNTLVLRLGPVKDDDTLNSDPSYGAHSFRTELTVADEPLQFSVVQNYNAGQRAANPTVPANWGWSTLNNSPAARFSGVMQRYTLIVRWVDDENKNRFYSLVAFKVRYRE